MSEREELAQSISANLSTWFGTRSFGPAHRDYELADALLAEGWGKRRTVATVEELDALGFQAVVLDPCGTPAVCQRSTQTESFWELGGIGASDLIDSGTLLLSGSSCTVLHEGDVSHRAAAPEPQS